MLSSEDHQRLLKRLRSQYKTRAKRRGIVFELDLNQIEELTMRSCFYCGAGPSNELKYRGLKLKYNGIDRIENDKGYVAGNCLTSCRFCNSLRGPMKWSTWSAFIAGIIRTHGGQVPPEIETEEEPHGSHYRFA